MGRLQKSHKQRQYRLQQDHSTAKELSTTHNTAGSSPVGQRNPPCPPNLRQQNPKILNLEQSKRRKSHEFQKSFEHTVSAVEPPFVALGRNQHLNQTHRSPAKPVNSQKLSLVSTPSETISVNSTETVYTTVITPPPRSSSINKQGSDETIGSWKTATSQHISLELSDRLRSGEAISSWSHEDLDELRAAALRQVKKKRSQSLPAMSKTSKDLRTVPEKSLLPETAETASGTPSTSATNDQLPFTPKIDLESVFKSISTTHDQKLANAQRKSLILWSKHEVGHRAQCREAGVIKKKQRRVSLPTQIGQHYSIPYEETKPQTRPHLRSTLKGELPSDQTANRNESSKTGHLSVITSFTKPATREASKAQPVTGPFTAALDQTTNDTIPDCSACPHCGRVNPSRETTNAVHTTVLSRASASSSSHQLDVDLPSSDLPQTSPQVLAKQVCKPCTPTEVTVAERLEAARKTLLAAKSKAGVERVYMLANSPPETSLVEKEARLQHTNDFSSTEYVNKILASKSAVVFTKDDLSEAGSTHTKVKNSPEMTRRAGQGRTPHRMSYDIQQTTDRSDCLSSNAREEEYRDSQLSDRVVSTHSDITRSRSSSVSISQGQQTMTGGSRSKLNIIVSNAQDGVMLPIRNASTSPARGVLSISPKIVPKISELTPPSSTFSLPEKAPPSPPLKPRSRSRSQSQVMPSDPTAYALNISRSNKRSSFSASRAREQSQTRRESSAAAVATLPKHEDVKTEDADRAAPPSPGAGTQSLLQFKNNCRPIAKPPSNPIHGTPLQHPQTEALAQPFPLGTSRLRSLSPPRRRLQKSQPSSEEKPRGRTKSRTHTISSSIETDSTKKIASNKLVGGLDVKHPGMDALPLASSSKNSIVVVARELPRKARPNLPPNSYVTSKKREQTESRSRSRSRSRIRSLLQTVGLVGKEDSAMDISVETNGQTDIPGKRLSQSTNDLTQDAKTSELFKTSGPYEQIPGAQQSDPKKVRRKARMSDWGLAGSRGVTVGDWA